MSVELLERKSTVNHIVSEALEPSVWLEHLEKDLMKFWDKPAAYEMPNGLFPTYRTNSGEKIDPDNLP